jgi:hypothetical protein
MHIQALDYRLICLNGMIRDEAVRKAHLGRTTSRGYNVIEDAREYYRTATKIADDRAFFLKVTDTVASMFDQKRFSERIQQYRDASERAIGAPIEQVIEVTAKRFSLTDGERSSVLQHLILGKELSNWGLANAVTRAAQDSDSYDRATELEEIGGDIIELAPSEWKAISTSKAN